MSDQTTTNTANANAASFPPWATPAILIALALGIIVTGLTGFGVWDPWELDAAEQARTPDLFALNGLRTALLAAAFDLLGTQEWVGRLPNALGAVATVFMTYCTARALCPSRAWRAGLYAGLVLLGTPMFIINAQTIFGNGVGVFLQTATAWAALRLIAATSPKENAVWSGILLLFGTGSTLASGFLCGVLPILLPTCALIWLLGRRPLTRWSALGAAALACLMVAIDVQADRTSYSWVLGGAVAEGTPPSFDKLIEAIFHGAAPWSAFIPVAFGLLLRSGFSAEAEQSGDGLHRSGSSLNCAHTLTESQTAAVFVGTWLSVGFAATLIFDSRYGSATFLPVPAIAIACGAAITELRDRAPGWGAALVVALLVGLVLRDFSIYPALPIDALGALDDVKVPDAFNPIIGWAAVLGVFAIGTFVAFDDRPTPDKHPRRFGLDITPLWSFVQSRWNAGWVFRGWLMVGALIALGLLVFGALCWAAADSLGLVTIVSKWGRRLMFLPLLVPFIVIATQVCLRLIHEARRYREYIVIATGLLTGAFTSFYFVPELSAHLSPREIYDRFAELRQEGEPLGEYRGGSRAARYYTDVDVKELRSVRETVDFLKAEDRVWVVATAESLPEIDSMYRQASNEEHVFVVESEGATALLMTNKPIEGMTNANAMANAVRSEPPARMDQRTAINFADKVELIGYDLDLPHKGYVGAGESFKITWYWKVLASSVGNYKIFVHVDGNGLRLNGDHEPVHGTYPVRMWKKGEIIADTQTLDVGANYRPGQYTIYVGFWAGESRLDVKSGEASSNRARAGYLKIR